MTAREYQIEMRKAAAGSVSIANSLRRGYHAVIIVDTVLAIVFAICAIQVHPAFLAGTAFFLREAWRDYRHGEVIWTEWMINRQNELDQATAAAARDRELDQLMDTDFDEDSD